MSLIEDALKRAQEEAARQDDLERRAKRRWIPPEPPREKRRGAVIAAALVCAGGVVAGAWLWRSRRAVPRPAVSSRTDTAPPVAAPAIPAPLPQVEVAPPPGRAGGKEKPAVPAKNSVAPAAGRDRPAASPPAPPATRMTEEKPRPEEPASPRPAAPASPRPAPTISGAKAEPTSFVRVATLPGGTKIALDGIVYSETNPVALIDGRVVAPGGSVGDFQLVRVEQNRVELRGAGRTIWISLQ